MKVATLPALPYVVADIPAPRASVASRESLRGLAGETKRMAELPGGTVTFVFTDIERSTSILSALGPQYGDLLERHRQIVRSATEQHDGTYLESEGDGNFMAFQRAGDGVSAAIDIQRNLETEPWEGAEPKVRIGIHTGDAFRSETSYIGLAIHKARRICAAAHGGQVLLSEATRALVAQGFSPAVALKDLGLHRLKDLGQPERLFQVVSPELSDDFPPLRTLDTLPNNLPAQLTSFIGRTDEMEALDRLLQTSRLVTLLGAGGSGKTRLALQVAAEMLDRFPDGGWFIDLSVTSDAAQIPQLVAVGVDLSGRIGRDGERFGDSETSPDLEGKLLDHLRTSRSLIILDNCEHLVEGSADMAAALLRGCPNVTLLATSREPLGVPGEIRWPVPVLETPADEGEQDPQELLSHDSIQLFVDRAILNHPSFSLNSVNAAAVAQICRQLDGLPLAIELAAAWVHALSPQQILERLDDQFRLLASTLRGTPTRQQTLRAAVDWSYDLLSEPEQRLLDALAIFPGSFSLEAAEQICSDDLVPSGEVLSLMALLINKSLVIREGEGPAARYRLLETIRHYGRERLTIERSVGADFDHGSVVNPDQPIASPAEGFSPVLRREGEFWAVGTADQLARVRHLKGLTLLQHLIETSGREWHVLDLVVVLEGHAARPADASDREAVKPPTDGLEIIDGAARDAYRRRLIDLQAEMDEAQSMGNSDRASAIEEEMQALASELLGASGLGGRERKTGSTSERARVSVTKALKTAVQKIEKHHPELGAHLKRSITTGTFCSYNPDPAATYRWELDR